MTPKVLLVSRLPNSGFLPGANMDICILSFFCHKTVPAYHLLNFFIVFNSELLFSLESHLSMGHFLLLYKKTKMFTLLVSGLVLGPVLMNPDCHGSHNLYVILVWENENGIPTPIFLFIEPFKHILIIYK